MNAKDTYDTRLKMVEMHDDVIERIDKAIKAKHSIEACWLIYSCFESRINRSLEKVSEKCSHRICCNNPKVGIATRIDCLKRLNHLNYVGTDRFDNNLLGQVKTWCKERNSLVHALVSLNNYYGMDNKFLVLAKSGKTLLDRLYNQTTSFRNEYYAIDELPVFPTDAESKCRLVKNHKENS